MKKVTIPFLILFAIISFVACQKDNVINDTSLDASKTSAIKKGEPVVFTLRGAAAGSITNWSVAPSANVQINNTGNTASFLFGKAGMYLVSASSGNISATANVTVIDSTYNGSTYYYPATIVPLTGDQITLTPSKIDSSQVLIISAKSTNSYNCLNNSLASNLSTTGANYAINFTGVRIPGAAQCTAGQSRSSGMSFASPVANGNHVFTVVLNGITYTGSFIKNGTSYTFTWPYSSGVTISPLVIN